MITFYVSLIEVQKYFGQIFEASRILLWASLIIISDGEGKGGGGGGGQLLYLFS